MRAFLCAALLFAVVLTSDRAIADEPEQNRHAAEVLVDETTFRVDGTRGHLTRRRVVQINSAEGRERHGRLVLWHDSFRIIRNLNGQILDENGNRARRLRGSDVRDRAGSDGFSLYDDFRVRVAELFHDRYPYRVEWEWEVRYESLLHWPSWYPQDTRDPVHRATLEIDVPNGFPFRYNLQWIDIQPAVSENRGRTIHRWTTSMPPQPIEPLGPEGWTQRAAIHFAGDRFEVAGYPGSLASWREFGNWYRSVWNGHWDLPDDARATVRRLVEGVEDTRERARLVYQFVQSRTRYVSVQLGIGGWKPFDAAYVHERRYGDCKALTNYLQALLREVGIESFPALIVHDRPDLDPDFPANRFNHVVLFVPAGQGEPIWLEATSQHLPFGHLGPGGEGRHALVVTAQGGQLIRTPVSSAEANREQRAVTGRLHADGTLDVEVSTAYSGHAIASLRHLLVTAPAQRIEQFWREKFGLPRVTVRRTNQDGLEVTADNVTLSLDLTIDAYAQQVGRRLFVNPNITSRWTRVPPAVEERRQPVEAFRYAFVGDDTVRISLPEGFRVEIPLDDVVIERDFASYRASAVIEDDVLVYTRRIGIDQPNLPAEAYDDLRDFLREVVRADDRSLALIRSE